MNEANIHWLTDTLATGGDFSMRPSVAEKQLQNLIAQDVRLVIDCRQEFNDKAIWEQVNSDGVKVTYLHLPTDDRDGHHISDAHFDAAVEAALPFIERDEKVLAHCHMGVNRGPSTAYAILLALGWDAVAAFDLIRAKRAQAAIYYAEDALKAHLRRTEGKVTRSEMSRLNHHINTVMDDETWESIQHVMRKGHEQDARDMRLP